MNQLISLRHSFANYGMHDGHALWEKKLIQKVNRIIVIGIANVATALILLTAFGYTAFNNEMIFALVAFLCALVVNSYRNYIITLYVFYTSVFTFFVILNLKTGSQSYALLHYFPILISLIQILGRKETLKHMYILCGIAVLSIVILTIGLYKHYLQIFMDEQTLTVLMFMNIITSFISAVYISIQLVNVYLSQQRQLMSTIDEKNILLAEVFHRVKNNMNIITSLLNLKKNTTDNEEVRQALDECRLRVFSMALVHQNMLREGHVGLDFKPYIEELVADIGKSLGLDIHANIKHNIAPVDLEIDQAIPIGLLLNELVTNSYKYARRKDHELEILIDLVIIENAIVLAVSDNGPGFDLEEARKKRSLGLDIITSLSEQLNGDFTLDTNHGCCFSLTFPMKQ